MTYTQMLFIANLVACLVIAYICGCRLNLTNRDTRLIVRLKYTVLMSGSLTLGGLPVLFEIKHNALTLIAAVLVAILVMLEIKHWRHGPPACTFRMCKR